MNEEKEKTFQIIFGDELWGIRYWALFKPREKPRFLVYTYIGSTPENKTHFFRPHKQYGTLIKKTTKELTDDTTFRPFLIDMVKILEKTKNLAI